jgi:excisionase family DNA binding protein
MSDTIAARNEPSPEDRVRAILAKPYWDYGEAAVVLNVKVKTLRNMKYRREITFTRFGGKVYFPRQTILAELRRNIVACSATARESRRGRVA